MGESTQPIEDADETLVVQVRASHRPEWIGREVSLGEFIDGLAVAVRIERVIEGPFAGDLVFSYRTGADLKERAYIQGPETRLSRQTP
jgi:hypothetical protein